MGTMAGKLKGVMPATTPSGWRSDQLSISGPMLRLYSPFKQMRDAACEVDDLYSALQLAERIGMRLAVLGRDARWRWRRRSSAAAP